MVTEQLRKELPGKIRDIDLSCFTTWAIGGRAAAAFPETPGQLSSLLSRSELLGIPWTILGKGSNTLAPSQGWPGLVIILSGNFTRYSFSGTLLHAGAAAPLPSIAGAACCSGLGNLSFAAGIPGSLGGAVFMNAGAYGSSISDFVVEVSALSPDGQIKILSREGCSFEYRTSIFQSSRDVITGAVMALKYSDSHALRARAREVLELRRGKFPLKMPNAGSVFRKPANGIPPGKLIEDAGLKGASVGGARVSALHANFIENCGGATSDDVIRLIRMVQKRVEAFSGILLEPEIRVLGEEL
ncbi:UDP-N-acetylenolpyruvoylglucosamine reductase [Candidatus Fermentibacteria bacterium]|nr:MAG: UDP-N-acetylenolpyruvoylglucosamine reductase [Candidatus Fermentibacteria bacterium]